MGLSNDLKEEHEALFFTKITFQILSGKRLLREKYNKVSLILNKIQVLKNLVLKNNKGVVFLYSQ